MLTLKGMAEGLANTLVPTHLFEELVHYMYE